MVPADRVRIVGGGLAGSEAAWQLASRGVRVVLHEMRPARGNPIHRTGQLAELVCSNSFKSLELANAHGLLKAELRAAGSLVMACAEAARLPAGAALAVDRELFAGRVTRALEEHPLVEVVREEVTEIPGDGPAIVAAGPLCSEPLARAIAAFTGEASLAFYDAISPVIEGDSIDLGIAFRASRYGKGTGTDYLNCPMTREEYDAFYDALMEATAADLHEFDRELLFEGCLPIEELALRGRDTLRFGPMKPVGLTDPRTGRRPWAVVQLRQDNLAATHWSMVGFQNRIAWGEQPRVFRMIPGLAQAEFVKLGMIHRNTFINAPRVLLPTFQARARADLFFAGQISGVEGYTESTASGLVAGLGALALLRGEEPPVFPPETALGALQRYVAGANPAHYQPTNIAFGLLPPLPDPPRGKRERKAALSERALSVLSTYLSQRTPPGRRAPSAPAGHAPAEAPGGRG
ncbi:MAG: methylenetetrahydrofolate--tRNA-(uracil(54)-C(5))-methyltransferase (FADH(2)-oxidizing) TrmFO [Acidobacteria bacterium]|jgi:methylenetetrahydrofolate--tRNA-(uracil-5-)-methyltransferase|nr:methylenetetrahydrofolate--tRNA-(uracil(54)-C(5))-methyltransferase (FADH(2)-oxidizing) TrmFO [Acidobacteriota bacterium]